MSSCQLNGNVPMGAGGREQSCPARGDIDDESQRTGPNEDYDGREEQRTEPGAGGRADGAGLPAGQASLAALPGRRGCRPGASATRGLRCKPAALRAEVMKLCAEYRYEDFGPTLMAEELEKKGIVVDHDTVRRWWLASGRRT